MISEEELRVQLDHLASLSFTPEEITYLGSINGSDGQPIFKAPFLAWLLSLRLSLYTLTQENGDFAIKASGPWPEALLWETFVMNTLTELLTARLLADPETRQAAEAEAKSRLTIQCVIGKLFLITNLVTASSSRNLNRTIQVPKLLFKKIRTSSVF
jgi:nicotinic acid phosphoribosyltransferase